MRQKYDKYFNDGVVQICTHDLDIKHPRHAVTAAFDTENITLYDGVRLSTETLKERIKGQDISEVRPHLECQVYSWQVFDEYNGFYMTNDFDTFLGYLARAGYKYVWCYNAKFDFAQIDWAILGAPKHKWSEYTKDDMDHHRKGKPWQYSSLHNDMGARYCYKLWIPYKNRSRHSYVHSVELRDMANIFGGGLEKMLKDLEVKDNDGNDLRKLEFGDYQNGDIYFMSPKELAYCEMDVKGLYFAIKQYDKTIAEQTGDECHIFGSETNIMTAGGLAKKELLRMMYPDEEAKYRLKCYQSNHPMDVNNDMFYRAMRLYRGGICFLNPAYEGKLITDRKMYRYDVNSEYPFSMSKIPDLLGEPLSIPYTEWMEYPDDLKQQFVAVYNITYASGYTKDGYLGFWFDPFKRIYTPFIDIFQSMLMFEFEYEEFCKWYDLEASIQNVIIFMKGEHEYKPYVDKYYALKTEAKKEKKKSIEQCSKLLLNSSYGKLAERCTRSTGRYEYSEETGAIHYVRTGEETDAKTLMNVVIGSLVTAYARVWLMSHIRETYGSAMYKDFIYCDTDSIHGFREMDSDPYQLGGFKLEAVCDACKYLAPKTYFDAMEVKDGKVKMEDLEIHSKGISLKAIHNAMPDDEISLETLDKLFSKGQKFNTLCAMNVKGGKVLVPMDKYLVAPDDVDSLQNDKLVITQGTFSFFEEL